MSIAVSIGRVGRSGRIRRIPVGFEPDGETLEAIRGLPGNFAWNHMQAARHGQGDADAAGSASRSAHRAG